MSKTMKQNGFSASVTAEPPATAFDSDRYIKMRLRVCHDGDNLKGANLTLDSIVQAKDTITNIPILAHVITDDYDNHQFGGHDFHLTNGDNHPRLIYDETPIGIVPESCNYSIEQFEGRYYVYVDAYIWRVYANYAADILDRHTEVPISAELTVNEFTLNDDNTRTIHAFKYDGITILGDDVEPAMRHAAGFIEYSAPDVRKRKQYEAMCSELNAYLSGVENTGQNTKEASAVNEEVKETVAATAPAENDTVEQKEPEGVAPATQVEETAVNTAADVASEPAAPVEEETQAVFAMNALIEKGIQEAVAALGDIYWPCAYDVNASKVILTSREDGNVYAAKFSVSDNGTITVDKALTRQKVSYADAEDAKPAQDFSAKAYKAMLGEASKAVAYSAEIESLKAYKAQAEVDKKVAQIESYAAEFTDLNDIPEFKELMSTAASLPSAEVFKDKCYAIRGKNMKPLTAQVEESEVQGLRVPFALHGTTTEGYAADPLSRLVERYSTK